MLVARSPRELIPLSGLLFALLLALYSGTAARNVVLEDDGLFSMVLRHQLCVRMLEVISNSVRRFFFWCRSINRFDSHRLPLHFR